ncbi:hypothetical protein KM043_008289 [Ampulex compressa]|nr:hypothetical protein KM043_008289 [Ampulex compressa]
MGCAASGASQRKGSVRLMSTKLTFNEDQLSSLNAYFRTIAEEARLKDESPSAASVEATVERLVQRLVIGTGNLDPSFSSMFLISLNEPRRIKQGKFEYLLRIDALSTPAVDSPTQLSLRIEEDAAMPGFVRFKVPNPTAGRWRDYLDARGKLRRDLVKAKLANLLAATIKQDVVNRVDDRICRTPGQVVGPETLDKILKQPDYCKVFYGPAIAEGPLRETKNQRIVLIEDAGGILLRIGLEAFNTHEIEVRLLIGIGISSWSNLADYPRRVPLHHCDVLLHYTAAQSGMYAVAVGPYAGARCEDRATLWRIRVPAAEKIMNQHYADDSVPALTESVLVEVLYHLREARPLRLPIRHKEGQKEVTWCSQDRMRVVSRHILRTVHRWSLERAGPDPLTTWAPDTLAHHVLLSLDELVTALRCQNLRCYFHPRCNVMLQCARGGIVHHEDSYVADSRLLQSYLAILHRHSSSMRPGVPGPLDVMESELIVKWRNVMASIPRGTMDADHGYSGRQLEYLSLILKEILRMKDASLQDSVDNTLPLKYLEISHCATEPIENLVYLLKLVLKQARDQIHAMSNRRMRTHDYRNILKKRKHCNTASHYDYSVGLLIDIVRRDRETAHTDLESYTIMARMLLRWLYFGIEYDRKILEPILRPYLSNLFNGLHEYCWNAELWRSKYETYTSEMRSLARFCKLVTTQKVSPSEGIIEFLSKGWYWAESMARTIERSENSLSLIFITAERTFGYNLVFADNKGLSAFSTWSKVRSIGNIARRKRITSRIIAPKSSSLVPNTTTGNAESEGVAGHVELRDVSPLTYVASMCKCQARQRGPGDLISAMISLSKFRGFQRNRGTKRIGVG